VQGGLVLVAGGIGLQMVSARVADDASQPLHALGVLAIALGLGFVISAIISFVISQRLGLIETATQPHRAEPPDA
jgi:heme/copper-type cytochrome/quinol oxidase subunit 3